MATLNGEELVAIRNSRLLPIAPADGILEA